MPRGVIERVSGGGGGSGTVTDVSVTANDGITETVNNPTTTPEIVLGLGDITPDSVTAVGTVTGSNLSGTNTGDQNLFRTIAVSGQSDIVADSTTDTLTIAAGTNITLTTNATTDTLTINATGGGDVVGPASASDNAITRYDNTTGKLIQNSGAFVDDSNRILTGSANSITTNSQSPAIQAQGTDSNTANIGVYRFSANATQSRYTLNKSRNGSIGSHTALNSGDAIGSIDFNGSNGTTFNQSSQIIAEADAGFTGANASGRIRLLTSTSGGTLTEALKADSAQLVTLANAAVTALTASRAVVTDGSKVLTSSATTATEIGYVNGVTSAIQTQLNAKQAAGYVSRSVAQSSHGFTVGKVLYLVGTTYTLAQADTVVKAEAVGIVSTVTDANNFILTVSGLVTGLSGLTAGTVYFLSPSSAGDLTATEPTTVGQVSKPLLIADSTTSGYFINFRGELLTDTTTSLINVTTSNINAKNTGATTLYTVPAGKTAIINRCNVRCTAVSSISVGPTCGVGTAPATDDIFTNTAITALNATTEIFGFDLLGMSVVVPAGGNVVFNITAAATGTSQTLAVDLVGYLV